MISDRVEKLYLTIGYTTDYVDHAIVSLFQVVGIECGWSRRLARTCLTVVVEGPS